MSTRLTIYPFVSAHVHTSYTMLLNTRFPQLLRITSAAPQHREDIPVSRSIKILSIHRCCSRQASLLVGTLVFNRFAKLNEIA